MKALLLGGGAETAATSSSLPKSFHKGILSMAEANNHASTRWYPLAKLVCKVTRLTMLNYGLREMYGNVSIYI